MYRAQSRPVPFRYLSDFESFWRPSQAVSCLSVSSLLMPYVSWILPASWSRLPPTTSSWSSVSLPHCCLTVPLNCFQLPSTRSQFIRVSFRSGLEHRCRPERRPGRLHALGPACPSMTFTRSPSRNLPGFVSIITRLDPSCSRTVISLASDSFSVSRIDSTEPHSAHFILARANSFKGWVPASIVAPGVASSIGETGRVLREAPSKSGIHAISTAHPTAPASVVALILTRGGRERGELSSCFCMREVWPSSKDLSVRWRA